MKKRLRNIIGLLLLIFIVAYMGAGYFIYNSLSDIAGRCDDKRSNRPDNFTDTGDSWDAYDFDFASFYMPDYETVSFPSREPGIEISAWYVEADPEAPAVIVVHGLGACKYQHTVLVPAGMLWHEGFNVLLMDVRDAGDSTFEDGRSAIGNEEFLDVLGGWDWLQEEKGISAGRIGLLGNSMGAATTLIAFSEEPQVAALFVDSPFDNLPQIIREELVREEYPQFLYYGGIWMARLVAGDNVLAYNPNNAIEKAGTRPIFLVHGTADSRIGVHHSRQIKAHAEEVGAPVTIWIVEGVEHVRSAAAYPQEYQAHLVRFFGEALNQ